MEETFSILLFPNSFKNLISELKPTLCLDLYLIFLKIFLLNFLHARIKLWKLLICPSKCAVEIGNRKKYLSGS